MADWVVLWSSGADLERVDVEFVLRQVPDNEPPDLGTLEAAGFEERDRYPEHPWNGCHLYRVRDVKNPYVIHKLRQGEGRRLLWRDVVAKAEEPVTFPDEDEKLAQLYDDVLKRRQAIEQARASAERAQTVLIADNTQGTALARPLPGDKLAISGIVTPEGLALAGVRAAESVVRGDVAGMTAVPSAGSKLGAHGSTMDRVREARELWEQGVPKTEACKRAHIDTRTYDRYVENVVDWGKTE